MRANRLGQPCDQEDQCSAQRPSQKTDSLVLSHRRSPFVHSRRQEISKRGANYPKRRIIPKKTNRLRTQRASDGD